MLLLYFFADYNTRFKNGRFQQQYNNNSLAGEFNVLPNYGEQASGATLEHNALISTYIERKQIE